MTTMVAELYDALLAVGAPDEKARKAAEAMADYEIHNQRLSRVEADIGEIKRDIGELKAGLPVLDRRVSGIGTDVASLRGEVLLLE
jgi:hypothetical protein